MFLAFTLTADPTNPTQPNPSQHLIAPAEGPEGGIISITQQMSVSAFV